MHYICGHIALGTPSPAPLGGATELRGQAAMARKKISTTVYITPEQSERLKLLHERTRVPVAEYIRQGIDMVLDHYRGDLPGQLTLDDLGPKK